MNRRAALRTLGLKDTPDLSSTEVQAAARQCLRENHPDFGGTGAQIEKIKMARDVLLSHCKRTESLQDCEKCDGTGKIKARRVTDCPRCQGSGKTRKKEI